MPHDKIKSAARARQARTGEPYAAARRAVRDDHRDADPSPGQPPAPRFFLIRYRAAGLDRATSWFDSLLGAGPGRAGVLAGADQLRIRMGDFRLTVPRAQIRSVARSTANLHGTTGVHAGHGRLLVNGAPDGLVELTLDPPLHTGRGLSTLFTRARFGTLVLSLDDPEGFVTELTASPGPQTT